MSIFLEMTPQLLQKNFKLLKYGHIIHSLEARDLEINTLYNVCAVPWGVCSTVGVFSTVGDILSTVGDIMINMGDILSTMGVFSTVGDIMSTVGGYLEYRGDVQYRGGCSVPWGIP